MKYRIIQSQNYSNIQRQYQLPSLLAKIIDSHHYDDQTIQNLLNPRLIYHDFSLFEEADITLDRIQEAIDNDEKICIYGDYDCDGILATTILVQAFQECGVQVGYHIPHRQDDGYGLNKERVKQMAEKGYTLIITVDNGVKAFEAIEEANENGIDVIVTDHHQIDNDLPDACSFIHTQLSPDYPFKDISGGFVAYKLATALLGRQDKYLYCLAALTTISDMMPLLDENRSLVKKALELMREEKYTSLELLLGNQQNYSTTTLGFTIAPKINSFGRLPELCHPNILVKYFLKDAPTQLMMRVSQMANEINTKRQSLTQEQYMLAMNSQHDSCLYWASPDVHIGLLGLIAGKYTREYEKPSFVMHYDLKEGLYKGSARSVEGFPLHTFFQKYREDLVTFGGHALAGGFTVDDQHFQQFQNHLMNELKDVELFDQKDILLIDSQDISLMAVESLSRLEPFGMSNEEPLLLLQDVPIANIGLLSEGKHLKIHVDYPHVKMTALYFHGGKYYEQIKSLQLIDLIGTLSINEFRGQKNINFIIKDIMRHLSQ